MLSSSIYFSASSEKHIGLNGSRTKILAITFLSRLLHSPVGSLVPRWFQSQLCRPYTNYVYKNSVTYCCGMCFIKCTEWWSSNLVKSSGWKSGRESYWVVFGCHISHSVLWTLWWTALQFVISPTCWSWPDSLFLFGGRNFKGQSSQLQRQRCVGSSDYS